MHNTSTTEERIFLLKPKSVLDEPPAESTDIESNNVIKQYSKRPEQLQKFCLADYVSRVEVIYPKGDKLPGKLEEKKMMMAMMKVVLVMTMKTVWKMRMMLVTVVVQICYTKQRME